MARPTFVDYAIGSTSSGDNFTTMPISVPASRAVGDLMLVGVSSHSGGVNAPTDFTELSRPASNSVLAHFTSTVAGGGTITATSSGGAHGRAFLVLIRGAVGHAMAVAGLQSDAANSISLPAVGPSGATDGLHIFGGFHRNGFNDPRHLPVFSGPAATMRWATTTDWGSALWTRDFDAGEAVQVISNTASARQMVAWNLLLHKPGSAPTVGYIGSGL